LVFILAVLLYEVLLLLRGTSQISSAPAQVNTHGNIAGEKNSPVMSVAEPLIRATAQQSGRIPPKTTDGGAIQLCVSVAEFIFGV